MFATHHLESEGQGIDLWRQLAMRPSPAYVLPWSREMAEQLQTARREAEQNETPLEMRLPFEPSPDDRELKFYAMPQPAPPPKDPDQAPPEFYEQARSGPQHEI